MSRKAHLVIHIEAQWTTGWVGPHVEVSLAMFARVVLTIVSILVLTVTSSMVGATTETVEV